MDHRLRVDLCEAAADNFCQEDAMVAGIDVAHRLTFEVTNRVEFTLQPQGADTQVTWAMSGPMPTSRS